MKFKLSAKHSQSSLEFILLIACLLFFFSLFFLAIQENISDTIRTSKDRQLQEIALTIQDEINLASKASEGYSRKFILQEKINNYDYSITIADNLVYLKTSDNRNSIALPIQKIIGNIVKGANIIKKQDGEIYIN